MRIVLIQGYEQFPDSRIPREVDLLVSAGHEVTVVLWQKSKDGAYIRESPDILLERIVIPARVGMKAFEHLKLQPRFQWQVYQRLKKLRPDMVIAHNLETALPSVLYRLTAHVPIIYVSREPYHKVIRMKTHSILGQIIGWIVDATVAHLSSAVVTVTPMMVKMYRAMGIDALFAPSAPTRNFLEVVSRRVQGEKVVVGFLGYLRPHCGIELMWEALKFQNRRCGRKRYHLFLCGQPASGFEEGLAQMEAEAPNAITVHPSVYADEIPSLYNRIHIMFHLPEATPKYKKYGITLKIVEALAAGIPVITNYVAENAALLKGTGACMFVADHSPEIVADVLGKLGEDPELRFRMGEKGRNFIREKYNWDMFANRYLALVERVLSRGTSRLSQS